MDALLDFHLVYLIEQLMIISLLMLIINAFLLSQNAKCSFWLFVKETATNKGSKVLRSSSQKMYTYQNFNYKENISFPQQWPLWTRDVSFQGMDDLFSFIVLDFYFLIFSSK